MPTSASQQLNAIASMMASGQRNLRMERWSLILWGLAGGLLFLFSESIFTPAQLPDLRQRALAWLLLIALVLGAVGTADWHLTQRAKQARDEVWSFIHRQVLKVLWLLMGIGALLTFAVSGASLPCPPRPRQAQSAAARPGRAAADQATARV